MMENFAVYSHAIASLALWSLIHVVLGMVSTVGRSAENRCDCGAVKRDYSDIAYRRGRAFANAIEMSGPFVSATVAAILVGASPFWVNLLASVFVLSRAAMAIVHIRTEIQPLRSAMWFIGLLCVVALGIIAFWSAI
jgi:uncharacterized MAPEG superfamily protein